MRTVLATAILALSAGSGRPCGLLEACHSAPEKHAPHGNVRLHRAPAFDARETRLKALEARMSAIETHQVETDVKATIAFKSAVSAHARIEASEKN